LGLILFNEMPTPGPLKLQFYPPELPMFDVHFEAQGEVRIQAKVGCCLKGTFSYTGTPLEDLFTTGVCESEKGPGDMPRGLTPA
jgi:hypothetical protein